MAIVVNEASRLGVHTFIRVGSGSLNYISNCYIIPEYLSIANSEVLLIWIEAAESLGITNYHVGVTATAADFYAGQNRHMPRGCPPTTNLLKILQKAEVLNF